MLVLHKRFVVAAGFDQGVHQLQVQGLVKGVHIQGGAAYVDDLLVKLLLLEQVQVLIHQLQVGGVQRNGTVDHPLLLVALEQVSRIQAEHLLVIRPGLGR